jgi:hypothetical protein
MVELRTNAVTGTAIDGLDRLAAKVKQSVIFSGAAAMARVFYEELKLNTSGARATGAPNDPPGVKTGTLHDAVYRVYAPELSTGETKVYHVSVNKSKAPHWWLIEYGNSRAPAHPYIRPALDKTQEAIKAGSARMKERLAESGVGGEGLP